MSQDKRPRENASRVGDFLEERVECVVLFGGVTNTPRKTE
jgi:hypothetical protein